MKISIDLPQLNISEEQIKFLLAVKLLEDGYISLGKAAEIVGYTEKTFAEILLNKGISPIRYEDINLEEEIANA